MWAGSLVCLLGSTSRGLAIEFRAGAAMVDVTPQQLPVIRNGGFLEATDDRVVDPLHARCICLAGDGPPVVLVIVDSCMIPVDVCDRAKELAHQLTGIPRERMLIAATHAHSCPSVMDYCLGSRADPAYREFLPGKIAEAIQAAYARLEPAAIGWVALDAGDYTKNRRWITRPDTMLVDPFGDRSVRAMMHPGHESLEYVGPAGPIDPWLTVLAIRSNLGRPLAMLANFSMHYFGGHPGVSADYYGRFCAGLSKHYRGENPEFVAIMSQGTSGDLWWGDYSRPARSPTIEQFSDGLVNLAVDGLQGIRYAIPESLQMLERRLPIDRRLPSPERLAWARRMVKLMGDRQPQDQPEVYAEQAIYLDSHPTDEVVLQTIQIGPTLITAIPNEVFALTGLKLKAQSPLGQTMNIELANGACGYIPPPEQHALGGYNTWPARTAGLAVDAEPKIVASLLEMIEQITGLDRRAYREPAGSYAEAVLAAGPSAYWGCGEQLGSELADRSSHARPLAVVGHVAYHLPGADGTGFGTKYASRAIHLAGGHLACADVPLGPAWSLTGWFWNGLPSDVREITGVLLDVDGQQLRLTGTTGDTPGRLAWGDHLGGVSMDRYRWYHVALVRGATSVDVYLDGVRQAELTGAMSSEEVPNRSARATIRFGQGQDPAASWEGRVDELAVFDRALTADEIARHVAAAGAARQPDPPLSRTPQNGHGEANHGAPPGGAGSTGLDSAPLGPEQGLRSIRVRDGFHVERVAAEPLVHDPVAIDWGADGRLWVAEMADYPMGLDDRGQPGGRIRWLADNDGDGRYDQSTVFLDGVPFPNGVLAWRDGVLVTAAPQIFWARDTDGNGTSDVQVPLYTGFLAGNQQLRVNGLRWGLDNWIHCASGGHHAGYGAENSVVSVLTGQRVQLGSRDLRIQPDRGGLEPESGPSQFGRVRDDAGNWFGVQNVMPLWHYVLEDRYLARNPDVAAPEVRHQVRVPLQPPVYPAKQPEKRYHGFDHIGHYTSACGIEVYRDELLFPREAARQHAFTCEPFHNLVQHHWVDDEGTTFRGQRASDDGPVDIFASTDRWCRPVMVRTGPDGALYVVDMYRYMIEHPEWLPPDGQEELRPQYRAGHEYGRIYRVVRDGIPLRDVPRLQGLDAVELVTYLEHPNGLVRDWAQRQLVEAEDPAAKESLQRLVRSGERYWSRLQALSILAAWNALDATVWQDAMRDQDPRVQRWAVQLAERWADSAAKEVRDRVLGELVRLAAHPDPRVRLQLACTLGEFPDDAAAGALAQLARQADDDYQRAAVVSSLPKHWQRILGAASAGERVPPHPPGVLEAAFSITRSSQERAAPPTALRVALDRLDADWSAANVGLLAGGLRAWQQRGLHWEQLEPRADPALQTEFARLRKAIDRAAVLVADQNANAEHRTAALGIMGTSAANGDAHRTLLLGCLAPSEPLALQLAAVRQLASVDDGHATAEALVQWQRLSPAVRQALVQECLQRPVLARSLAAHCAEHPEVAQELTLADRQRLLRHDDEQVSAAARTLFATPLNEERQAVIDDYYAQIATTASPGAKEQLASGRALFDQHCAVCHRAGGGSEAADPTTEGALPPDGVVVQVEPESTAGPDLRTLTDRSLRGLLTAVLDPSRAVEPKYAAYTVELTNGQVLQGIVTAETATSLELRLADGQRRTVLRSAIEQIHSTGRSLMPDGMELILTPSQMTGLIAYLQSGVP